MAHFARIENGYVSQVIVVNNDAINNLEFPDSEKIGQEFIASIGLDGTWKQTSYNGNFRNKFAAVGDKWTGHNFKEIEEVTPTE